jgi:hypothetical protein
MELKLSLNTPNSCFHLKQLYTSIPNTHNKEEATIILANIIICILNTTSKFDQPWTLGILEMGSES